MTEKYVFSWTTFHLMLILCHQSSGSCPAAIWYDSSKYCIINYSVKTVMYENTALYNMIQVVIWPIILAKVIVVW
jgi:hypothetical protein